MDFGSNLLPLNPHSFFTQPHFFLKFEKDLISGFTFNKPIKNIQLKTNNKKTVFFWLTYKVWHISTRVSYSGPIRETPLCGPDLMDDLSYLDVTW